MVVQFIDDLQEICHCKRQINYRPDMMKATAEIPFMATSAICQSVSLFLFLLQCWYWAASKITHAAK